MHKLVTFLRFNSRKLRGGQSDLSLITIINSIGDGCSGEPSFSTPFRDSERFISKRNKIAGSAVGKVYFDRSPVAIGWLIISIIVDAINLVFWKGLFTHIGKEVFKRFKPLIANNNAATSVVFKRFILSIVATIFHRLPSLIFLAFRSEMSSFAAVRKHIDFRSFFGKAAAGFCVLTSKATQAFNAFSFTITFTKNVGIAEPIFVKKFNDQKSSEFFTDAEFIHTLMKYKARLSRSSVVKLFQFRPWVVLIRANHASFNFNKFLEV